MNTVAENDMSSNQPGFGMSGDNGNLGTSDRDIEKATEPQGKENTSRAMGRL